MASGHPELNYNAGRASVTLRPTMTEERTQQKTYIEVTVHGAAEGAECGRVGEEGWDEVDLAGGLGVLRELGPPARWGVGSAEGTGLPRERRDECLAAGLELGGPVGECGGQGAEGRGVIGGVALGLEGAGDMRSPGGKCLQPCKRLAEVRTPCQMRRRA